MNATMTLQVALGQKFGHAGDAFKPLNSIVSHQVQLQLRPLPEGLATLLTIKLALIQMESHVRLEYTCLREQFAANLTLIRLLASVTPNMNLETLLFGKTRFTILALEWLLTGVGSKMTFQVPLGRETRLTTNLASVSIAARGHFVVRAGASDQLPFNLH